MNVRQTAAIARELLEGRIDEADAVRLVQRYKLV